jgi:hypothetical protein
MAVGNEGSSGSERRCAYPGCTTKLSVYNSDYLCWTHADAKTRAHFDMVQRGKRTTTPAVRTF